MVVSEVSVTVSKVGGGYVLEWIDERTDHFMDYVTAKYPPYLRRKPTSGTMIHPNLEDAMESATGILG